MRNPKRPTSKQAQLLHYMKKKSVCRSSELYAEGFNPAQLHRLEQKGLIERVGRGLYSANVEELAENRGLVEVAKRVPSSVVCLLSALQFHNMTDESPFEIWVAIDNTARKPSIDYPPIRIIRMSEPALAAGVQVHIRAGNPIRVFSPAKTVADCFKFRHKIGLDVAIEALKDCLRKKLATRDEIMRFAKICRVQKVIRPYLETLS